MSAKTAGDGLSKPLLRMLNIVFHAKVEYIDAPTINKASRDILQSNKPEHDIAVKMSNIHPVSVAVQKRSNFDHFALDNQWTRHHPDTFIDSHFKTAFRGLLPLMLQRAPTDKNNWILRH